MVATRVSSDLLLKIFNAMDIASRKLEEVIVHESEAVHHFDADELVALMAMRQMLYQELNDLETQCHLLMQENGVSDSVSLEAFIELYASGEDAMQLQALRRTLYQRMQSMVQASEDNRIYLYTAHAVTTDVLHTMGVLEHRTTYSPGSVK